MPHSDPAPRLIPTPSKYAPKKGVWVSPVNGRRSDLVGLINGGEIWLRRVH